MSITCLRDVPRIAAGDPLVDILCERLKHDATVGPMGDGDVVSVTSKLISRAEGRFVRLASVLPGANARRVADQCGKDPRLVELILGESQSVSRVGPGVLIVRHRLGFVCANAGIDASNAGGDPATTGKQDTVLLLPKDPDGAAAQLRAAMQATFDCRVGVVVTDSHSRAFRLGTVGVAVGCAGLPSWVEHTGAADLDGRPLEHTRTALADQLAATADLVAGQGDEGRPVCVIRGLQWSAPARPASDLYRSPDEDLYA